MRVSSPESQPRFDRRDDRSREKSPLTSGGIVGKPVLRPSTLGRARQRGVVLAARAR